MLAIIAVLYNQALETVPLTALARSMSEDRDLAFVVVDNSENPDPRAKCVAYSNGIEYIAMGSNQGLAAAYNRAIADLSSDVEFVLLLDQDTLGVGDYLADVRTHLKRLEGDILMPLVVSGSLILSPCRRLGPWYGPVPGVGHNPRHFSCINSGMIVRRTLFDQVRFDENLFLDYVDHKFIRDASAAGAILVPGWEYRLEQDYSRTTDSAGAARARISIFAQDVRRFYGARILGRAYASLLVGYRQAKAALHYRDVGFLRRL